MNSKRKNSEARNFDSVEGFDQSQARGTSGQVKFDDRGNAVWDWKTSTQGLTRTQRLNRLDVPTLSLAEDAPTPFDKVQANPLGTKKGYNPYDSGKLGKTNAAAKKKDLRRLSDWFKLKKQQSLFKKSSAKD